MKWASGISEQISLASAVEECTAQVLQQLGDANPDLAVVFASTHHRQEFETLPALVKDVLGPVLVLGCSGGGIIGNGQEVEQQSAVSITVANLPDVELVAFHLEGEKLPDLDAGPDAWQELVQVTTDQEPHFVLLADPISFPAQNLILGLDFAFPNCVKIGGLASGSQEIRQNALFLGDQVHSSGAVGVALHGNISLDTVVAQGCRPIGKPMRITESRRNLLVGLNGQTPMAVLRELFQELSERDRGLMRHSLFLGVVMDEFTDLKSMASGVPK